MQGLSARAKGGLQGALGQSRDRSRLLSPSVGSCGRLASQSSRLTWRPRVARQRGQPRVEARALAEEDTEGWEEGAKLSLVTLPPASERKLYECR